MSGQLQLRRGTTAQNDTFTGAVGELTYNTDDGSLISHNGVTAGGYPGGGYLYEPGAVVRSVQAKLQETVSVEDFGADPTGVLPSDTAFNNAAAFSPALVPSGTYLLNTSHNNDLVTFGQVNFTGTGTVKGTPQGLTTYIHNNTSSSELGTVYIRRNAEHVGGTLGNVSSALFLDTYTGAATTNYEWGLTSRLNNYAVGGENVAIYSQGNKMLGAGSTWAMVAEARDKSGLDNPTKALVGIEVDVFADGTDVNNQRIGVYIVGGVGVSIGPTIYAGILVGPQNNVSSNCNFSNGLLINGISTRGINLSLPVGSTIGIDISSSTLSSAALRISNSQYIGFDVTDSHVLGYGSNSGLEYRVSGSVKSRLNDDGSIALNAGVTVVNGTINSGSSAPVLTANKPGANTAVGAWLSVQINGAQHWIPAWVN